MNEKPSAITTPAAGRNGISVVLNTYNAAQYLQQALEAVKDFEEIVIVDMHSTDATREIASRFGARIIDHERCGICEPARNTAIQAASYPWVLIIDADEIVTPQLRQFLYDLVSTVNPPAAVRIPRRNSFMGKELKCLYPDYITRFARKDAIFWPPEIHSQPVITGQILTIPKKNIELAFIHLESNNVDSRLEKIVRYSAKEVVRRGPKRYSYIAYLLKPFSRFFRSYLLKGGWRDGKPGYIWARLEAVYKLSTMTRQEEAAQQSDLNKSR